MILYARPAPPVASTTARGVEHLEAAALALVADHARRAAVGSSRLTTVNSMWTSMPRWIAVILQRADHLEAGAIADVREPRIAMAAEIPLQDPAVLRAIEDGAPGFELADAIGRFLGVQLRHAPVVHVLAAAHRVGEVDLPAVAVVDVGERRRDAAFGHDGVGLAEERLADQPDLHAGRRRFDRRAQPGAAGADHQNVVFVRFGTSSQDAEVRPDAHRAEPHVEVGEPDREQAEPGEELMLAVQARARTCSRTAAGRSSRSRPCAPPMMCRSEWQLNV